MSKLTPKNSYHYYVDLLLNGDKVTAVVDTGSNSTIISVGACRALGLKFSSDDGKTRFSGADGSTQAYKGLLG